MSTLNKMAHEGLHFAAPNREGLPMAKCWAKEGDGIAWEPQTHDLHLCVWGLRKAVLLSEDLPERIRAELPTEVGATKIVLMGYRRATEDLLLPVDRVTICFEDHGKDGDK